MSIICQRRTFKYHLAAIVLFCGAMSLPAVAQVDCLTLFNRSPNTPSPRETIFLITGAYDSIRQVTVHHEIAIGATPTTWIWNGDTWTMASILGPLIGTPGVANYDMVFDSNRGVSVMLFFDVEWEWNGVTWTERTDVSGPRPLSYGNDLAFDSKRGVVVTFGGQLSSDLATTNNETWDYDGTSWTQRFPSNAPSPRTLHRISYDSERDVIVMFGGRDSSGAFDETWEYDRTDDSWQQVNIGVGSVVLLARILPGMAYDSARGVTVRYVGFKADLSTFHGDI